MEGNVKEAVLQVMIGIEQVSDEQAEQLELDFDFTPHYNAIALKDSKRALVSLVKEAIRLRASRETVNEILKLIAVDNDIIPIVIKEL